LQVFLVVALVYFTHIRRSMKKVEGLESMLAQRSTLKRAFRFTALTAMLITTIGCELLLSRFRERAELMTLYSVQSYTEERRST